MTSYFRLIYNRTSHESLFPSLCDVSSPSHDYLITMPGFLWSSRVLSREDSILFWTVLSILCGLHLLFSPWLMLASLRSQGLQQTRFPCHSLSLMCCVFSHWSLLKFMSIELVMLFHHLILLSPSSFAFNLSQHQGLFQWVGSSH